MIGEVKTRRVELAGFPPFQIPEYTLRIALRFLRALALAGPGVDYPKTGADVALRSLVAKWHSAERIGARQPTPDQVTRPNRATTPPCPRCGAFMEQQGRPRVALDGVRRAYRCPACRGRYDTDERVTLAGLLRGARLRRLPGVEGREDAGAPGEPEAPAED